MISEERNFIDDGTGVEPEDLIGEERVTDPFNPALIRFSTRPMTIDELLGRVELNELDLHPRFQRKDGIWTKGAKSRLIESLLLRIPLPAFYVSATDDDKWLIVDGLQRLTTLKSFILDNTLRLCELEFFSSFIGKTYADLPRPMQRRINDTQVTVYLIERGTPPDIKFDVFKRINTGWLPLSAQEIRHALKQGRATEILIQLAASAEFKKAVDNGIRDDRMADRECVLRSLAFTLVPYIEYKSKEFDSFLNDCMKTLNAMSDHEIEQLRQRFLKAMVAAWAIFGTDAFRKRYKIGASRFPINKALFESWSVNLGQLSEEQIHILIERKNMLQERFIDLMNTRDFNEAISQGTSDIKKVHNRFKLVQQLIEEVLA